MGYQSGLFKAALSKLSGTPTHSVYIIENLDRRGLSSRSSGRPRFAILVDEQCYSLDKDPNTKSFRLNQRPLESSATMLSKDVIGLTRDGCDKRLKLGEILPRSFIYCNNLLE